VAQQPEDQMRHDWLMYDFGQATANMMLAAADLGIGTAAGTGCSGSLVDAPWSCCGQRHQGW
jgi:hypothetical protein